MREAVDVKDVNTLVKTIFLLQNVCKITCFTIGTSDLKTNGSICTPGYVLFVKNVYIFIDSIAQFVSQRAFNSTRLNNTNSLLHSF